METGVRQFISTAQALHSEWCIARELMSRANAAAMELKTSLDVVATHVSASVDLTALQAAVEERQAEARELSVVYERKTMLLRDMRTLTRDTIKDLLSLFAALDLDERPREPSPSSASDDVATRAARLTYDNLVDNLQLRPDPPIDGVSKVPAPQPHDPHAASSSATPV